MERMDIGSKNQYLNTLLNRYFKVSRKGKDEILDEYCRNTGQNRKYVIRKIHWLNSGEVRF